MVSIFIRTIIIYIILYCCLKITGKRQIGELEVSELITTLLISEIAATPIGDPDIPLLAGIIPIIFITSLEVLLSTIKNKSVRIKHLVEGEPTYIIYKGKLNQHQLKANRLSINEVLSEIRLQGISDISEVYYAIIEQNGKLSVLSKKDCDKASHTLIIDGKICQNNLKGLGYSENWIDRQLEKQNLQVENVFLLTVKDNGEIYTIEKE